MEGEKSENTQGEDKNKNSEGKRVRELVEEGENLRRRSSEQPACNQHLNHSWRLTLSPLAEANCSQSPCEHISKQKPGKRWLPHI